MLPAQNVILNNAITPKLVTRGLVAHYDFMQKNLLKYSEDFSNAAWTKTRSSIVPQADGSFKLVEDNTAGNSHVISQAEVSTIVGKTYIFYIDVKAGERTWIQINPYSALMAATSCFYNLATGVIGTKQAGTSAGIIALGGDVYRCWIRYIAANATTGHYIYIAEGDNDVTIDGDITKGIYLYRAQLELGASATTYEKTLGNQTLWNRAKTGMYASNIVTNGNFANGTTGWSGSGAAIEVIDGVLVATGSGTAATIAARKTLEVLESGIAQNVKYYLRTKVKVTDSIGSNLTLRLSDGVTSYDAVIASPVINFPYTMSEIATITSAVPTTWRMDCRLTYADAATATGKVLDVYYGFAINLTAMFGAGNEPTQEVCDFIFSEWFAGTRYMEIPQYNGLFGSTTGADANDPTWTGQGASFDGGDYIETYIPIPEQATIIVVAKHDDINARCVFGQNGGVNSRAAIYQTGGAVYANVASTGDIVTRLVGSAAGETALWALRYSSGVVVANKNLSQSSPLLYTNTWGAKGTLWLGARTGLYHLGGEFYGLVYNRVLTDKEIKQTYKYLKQQLAPRGVLI